jgi:arginase
VIGAADPLALPAVARSARPAHASQQVRRPDEVCDNPARRHDRLLGLTGGLVRGALGHRRGTLTTSRLAMLGMRDDDWRRQFNVGSLRDHGVWLRDVDEVAADPAGTANAAVRHVTSAADRWWLHVDLDVLDPDELPAQGLPDVGDEPGGLTRAQLATLLSAAAGAGSCAGLSVAIYDPDQNSDGSGARAVVELVAAVAASLD